MCRGPEGQHSLVYKQGNAIKSNPVNVYFVSPVMSLTYLNEPPSYAEYGVPLDPQPRLLLLGADGKPVSSTAVLMFVNLV